MLMLMMLRVRERALHEVNAPGQCVGWRPQSKAARTPCNNKHHRSSTYTIIHKRAKTFKKHARQCIIDPLHSYSCIRTRQPARHPASPTILHCPGTQSTPHQSSLSIEKAKTINSKSSSALAHTNIIIIKNNLNMTVRMDNHSLVLLHVE